MTAKQQRQRQQHRTMLTACRLRRPWTTTTLLKGVQAAAKRLGRLTSAEAMRTAHLARSSEAAETMTESKEEQMAAAEEEAA